MLDSPKFHINMVGKGGMTPLMLAVQYNTNKIGQLMANKELDVNIEDRTGRTVLMHVIDGRSTSDNLKLARTIVLHPSYKANVVHELSDTPSVTSCTDLMYAIIQKRDDIAEIILALFATDVNIEDSDGQTALTHVLHRSIFYLESRTTMVWKLVQHHSYQVNKYHSDGTIDITNAVKFSKMRVKPGQDEVLGVLLLQPGVDINLRDHAGDTVYEMGLENVDFGLLDQLLRNPALDKKVLNTVNLAGRNILHLILQEYSSKTEKEGRYQNMDNFTHEILSYSHLNVSAKDIEGKSPVCYTLNSGEGRIPLDIIRKIISHEKYMPNQTYYDGYVDVLRSAQKLPAPVPVTVLSLLLDLEHLDVMVADAKGTILRYVQRAIMESSNNSDNTKLSAELKEIQKKLINHRSFDVNKVFNGKSNDLIWAAGNGYWELAEELFQLSNVDVNTRIGSCTDVKDSGTFVKSKCTKGMTVLHVACKYSDKSSNVVCKLLQHDKVDVNIQDSDGHTCLMYAVQHQSLYAVQAILSHPSICDINLKNSQGETVLDIVQKSDSNIDPMIVSIIRQGEKFVNTKGVKRWGSSRSLDCLLNDDQSTTSDLCKSMDVLDVCLDEVDIEEKKTIQNRSRNKQQTSQSMTISDLHHRKLLGNQSFLCEHLSPHEIILHFQKVHIMNREAANSILGAGTRRNIVLKLLSLLLKSSSVFYMQFLGALKLTGQGYIAEELETFDPVDISS